MFRATVIALLALAGAQDPKKREAAVLGMKFRDLTEAERADLALGRGAAKVIAVPRGGTADQAGLREGDMIFRVGTADIKNADDLMKKLYTPKYDTLTVARGRLSIELDVTQKMLDAAPAAGERAPDFTLRTEDGKEEVKLSSLVGARPVVLVFGSYT